MDAKSPLISKTLWANLVAVGAILIQSKTGFVVPPEDQVIVLSTINLVLRVITRQPLDWKLKDITPVILLALMLAAAVSLQGCATVTRLTTQQPILTELTFRAATGRVLDAYPEWVEPALALTGEAILRLDPEGETGLDELETYMIERIPWDKLAAEEEELLRLLITCVREEIVLLLKEQGIETPEAARVQVITALSWIHQSAQIRAARDAR